MFVKICRTNGLEILHECDSVTWNPYKIKDDPKQTKLNLCIIRKDGTQLIEDIDTEKTIGVYYMSETGATIDRKQW